MPTKKAVITILLISMVAIAGCLGGGGQEQATADQGGAGGDDGEGKGMGADFDEDQANQGSQSSEPRTGNGGDGGDGGDGGAGSGEGDSGSQDSFAPDELSFSQDRYVIRTGKVNLEVSNFDITSQRIKNQVEDYGGFVSDTQVELKSKKNKTWKTGSLVLRVPRQNFSDLLEYVKRQGKVLSSSTSAKDVTDQVTDLQARIDNLEAQRKRLRTLFEQANNTSDVLKIENRLSRTQEKIEKLQAQLQNLEQRVAFSTLTVDLSEPKPEFEKKPKFKVNSFDILDSPVMGKKVNITATVTNSGGEKGEAKVEYRFNGEVRNSTQVELEKKESKTVSFKFKIPEDITPANYPHSVAIDGDRRTDNIRVKEPEKDQEKEWYDTGVIAAFISSVNGAITMIRAAIVGVAYLFPYLVVFGIPLGGTFIWYRRKENSGDKLDQVQQKIPGRGTQNKDQRQTQGQRKNVQPTRGPRPTYQRDPSLGEDEKTHQKPEKSQEESDQTEEDSEGSDQTDEDSEENTDSEGNMDSEEN